MALNLIFATCTGNWELYLSCVEEVLPWAFPYDSQKYARGIRIPFIDYMHNLHGMPIPDVYKAFKFAVQLNNTNLFGRNEADTIIENTIKSDCKTKGEFGKSAKNYGNMKMGSQCFTENFLQEDAKRTVMYESNPKVPIPPGNPWAFDTN